MFMLFVTFPYYRILIIGIKIFFCKTCRVVNQNCQSHIFYPFDVMNLYLVSDASFPRNVLMTKTTQYKQNLKKENKQRVVVSRKCSRGSCLRHIILTKHSVYLNNFLQMKQRRMLFVFIVVYFVHSVLYTYKVEVNIK